MLLRHILPLLILDAAKSVTVSLTSARLLQQSVIRYDTVQQRQTSESPELFSLSRVPRALVCQFNRAQKVAPWLPIRE